MSTPSDSFAEEESQQNNATAEGTPDRQQTSERVVEQEKAGGPPSSSTLPPEAEGEANGGPLGCCLGVTVGLLLSLSIAVLSRLYADPLAHVFSSSLSLIIRVVMILIAIAAIIIGGYFGWKIGKNAYREYEPPVLKDRRKRKMAARSKRA